MPLVAGLFTHSFGSRAKDGQNRVRRRSAVTPRTVFDVVPRSRNRSVSGHFSTATAPVSRDLRCFFFLSPPSDHLKYRESCDCFHLDRSGLARCSWTFFFLTFISTIIISIVQQYRNEDDSKCSEDTNMVEE